MITELYSDQLLITLEATAAALYCQMADSRFSRAHVEQDEAHVPVGTRYLVVDAGGNSSFISYIILYSFYALCLVAKNITALSFGLQGTIVIY